MTPVAENPSLYLPNGLRTKSRTAPTQMHLLHNGNEGRRKASPSPELFLALVGTSTNSTAASVGPRVRVDTDPSGESNCRRRIDLAPPVLISSSRNCGLIWWTLEEGSTMIATRNGRALGPTPTGASAKSRITDWVRVMSVRVFHLYSRVRVPLGSDPKLTTGCTLVDFDAAARSTKTQNEGTTLPLEKRSIDDIISVAKLSGLRLHRTVRPQSHLGFCFPIFAM